MTSLEPSDTQAGMCNGKWQIYDQAKFVDAGFLEIGSVIFCVIHAPCLYDSLLAEDEYLNVLTFQ